MKAGREGVGENGRLPGNLPCPALALSLTLSSPTTSVSLPPFPLPVGYRTSPPQPVAGANTAACSHVCVGAHVPVHTDLPKRSRPSSPCAQALTHVSQSHPTRGHSLLYLLSWVRELHLLSTHFTSPQVSTPACE